jgi:hypothetical protein
LLLVVVAVVAHGNLEAAVLVAFYRQPYILLLEAEPSLLVLAV